ncbi:MAG TPA: hypothetical protein VMW10_00770, partial [Alphaproteobacteria bacterium]|nr:hypothetical protein [Alphaproteobacteria bacterium]
DIRTCQAWAETHRGTVNYEPASARCLDLQNCRDYRSSNENTWRECVYRAEESFTRQMSGQHTLPVEAPFGPESPIVTENSDSFYENRTGKGFSFDDAAQGD